jgi:hypothetical protein
MTNIISGTIHCAANWSAITPASAGVAAGLQKIG